MRKRSLYVPVHIEFFSHPKTWALADALGVSTVQAGGHLVCLWAWAKSILDDTGDLSRWRAGVIARAAQWAGDAGLFVEALVETGWLDRDDVSLRIHDADLYAGKPSAVRDAGDGEGPLTNAERSKRARARKRGDTTRHDTNTTQNVSRHATDTEATRDRHDSDTASRHDSDTQPTRKEAGDKRREEKTSERVATRDATVSRHENDTHTQPAMRWPTEPKPRTPNRGVQGMQETADKPTAEAAIRACLTSEGKDERLTGLLRDLGPDAGDALESLMGAWSRKYDMDGPQPALAGLKLWLREKTDKRKATDLHVEASKARAARNGLTVTTDGQVVTEAHEVWEALARQDWRRFRDAGEDVPSELSEFKALHRAHYASGGSSLWDAHVEANLGDVVPDFAGLVKGKPVSKQVPDEARTLARRDYDGLTGMGVQPGQRWTDYWAEHKDHYERGGGSRWEAHMAALEATPEPQVIAPGARVGESPVVNLWSGEAQDGGAQ